MFDPRNSLDWPTLIKSKAPMEAEQASYLYEIRRKRPNKRRFLSWSASIRCGVQSSHCTALAAQRSRRGALPVMGACEHRLAAWFKDLHEVTPLSFNSSHRVPTGNL